MKKSNNLSEKTEQEATSKVPIWLWILFGILGVVFVLWAVSINFQSFLIIFIIWLSLGFIFWKKVVLNLTIMIIFIGIAIIFSMFYLINFTSSKNVTDESRVKNMEALPKLEMTIVKSPQVINCSDEVSKIKVIAKNVGNKDLNFADVKSGKYDFGICDAENTKTISCFPLKDGFIGVNDFGTIKVGETKDIIFTTPTKYDDNAITSFKKAKVNGEYKYYIDFSQIKNPKLKPVLSKSNFFSVKTNIMNPSNEYIKVKCRKNK